jgi:hypothetical protein
VATDAAKVVWAIGFPFDCTVEGKAVEITSMIDERARVSLLHLVERSITAERLVAELEGVLAAAGGPPEVLRMDDGPELVSQALQQFCIGTVGLSYIPPRTPSNDRYIESFNNRATKGVPQPQPLDDPA